MSYRNTYNPEQLTAARRFVIASHMPMPKQYPLSPEIQRQLDEFDESLLGLVRAAVKVAKEDPRISPEEIPERWSPLASQMIKIVKGVHGNRNDSINLLDDFNVEAQRDLYELAVEDSAPPAE